MTRIEYEKQVVRWMIEIYCHAHHGTENDSLCNVCAALNDYAVARLSHCRFVDDKPSCKRCPVHCYNPQMREQIRQVMRYSGPRMLWHHPIAAVRHLIQNIK